MVVATIATTGVACAAGDKRRNEHTHTHKFPPIFLKRHSQMHFSLLHWPAAASAAGASFQQAKPFAGGIYLGEADYALYLSSLSIVIRSDMLL